MFNSRVGHLLVSVLLLWQHGLLVADTFSTEQNSQTGSDLAIELVNLDPNDPTILRKNEEFYIVVKATNIGNSIPDQAPIVSLLAGTSGPLYPLCPSCEIQSDQLVTAHLPQLAPGESWLEEINIAPWFIGSSAWPTLGLNTIVAEVSGVDSNVENNKAQGMVEVEDTWRSTQSTPLRGPDLVGQLVIRKGETVLENNHDEWAYLQTLNNIQHINPRIELGEEVDLIVKVTNVGNKPSSKSVAQVSAAESRSLHPSCTDCEFPYSDGTVLFRVPALQPDETWEGTITVKPDSRGGYDIVVDINATETNTYNNQSGARLEVLRPDINSDLGGNSSTKLTTASTKLTTDGTGGSGSLGLLELFLLYCMVWYWTRALKLHRH